jgi:hypothetical protein
VPTSRIWQVFRSEWRLFLAILIVGLAFVVAGWKVEDSQYGSGLLLQLGSTFILLVPLFVLERDLEDRVERLSEAVNQLRLKFEGQVGPDVEARLNDEVLRFHQYLEEAETRSLPRVLPRVCLAPEEESWAKYNPERKEIVAGPMALQDPDLVAHVYAHHVLESYEDYEGRLSNSFTAKSVEAGLADYLVAAFHDRPSFASIVAAHRGKKDAIRNLANDRNFSEIHFTEDYDPRDASSDEYHDAGEVWGGAFWELGGRIGRLRIGRSLLQAWERFDPAASTSPASPRPDVEFVRELLATSPSKHREWVRTVFNRRGLVV